MCNKKYYGFLYCCRTYKFTFLCFKENKNCHLFKDRGYDASILYLKEKYPKQLVSRHPGSFCYYYNEGNEDYLSIMSKINDSLRKKILSYTCMDSLKNALSKNEKKLFVVEEYINTIGMVKTFIEFDIYQMSYELIILEHMLALLKIKRMFSMNITNVLQKFIIFMINMNLMKDF